MIYIFDQNGKCIAASSEAVNEDDLAIRQELPIESDKIYDIEAIQLVDGEITAPETDDTQQILPNAPVNEDTLALAEAILELSAEVDKLKGGTAQ